MNKIMMEYWEDRLKKYVDVKIKGLPGRRRKEVSVEDPKAWRVVSVENSTEFNPNQFLSSNILKSFHIGIIKINPKAIII